MSSRPDKAAAVSPASPVSPRPTTLSPRSPDGSDVGDGRSLVASLKSFRRKKVGQQRLNPLESESPRRQRPPHPQRHLSLASPSSPHPSGALHSRSPTQEPTGPEDSDKETLQLQRLHALSTSDETVEQWIRTYEAERGAFASFAVFTEVKLDEVQESYVLQAGRPNAVEAAACCATLLKMPGIVGCYKTLLEKVATGIQAAVYLPDSSSPSPPADASVSPAMATIVRRFYSRTPYFARVRDLEKALSSSRSLSDPNVLRAISSDDVARIFQYVPFHHVQVGLARVYATSPTMLDQLVDVLQAQQGLLLRSRAGDASQDPEYPVHVPLATSAQICRAITQHAASFSSSGRDMILCAILEFVDVDSFRDVFKRFDTQGKVSFLHHLSLLESSDQLQMVVDALPNAGESLFRLYFVACTGQSGGFSGESGATDQQPLPVNPKDVFFASLLSPEMEFFFLCDLATYLSEAQWQMLSREVERNESERKARRLRQSNAKARAEFDMDIDEDSSTPNAAQTPSGAASLDSFQMMMWRYLRHHSLSSAQLLQLVANTFLSALEEKEFSQLLDSCWARFPLDGQWSKVLAVVEDLDAGRGLSSESGSPSASQRSDDNDSIAAIRLKLVKKLFSMLSREERAAWMDRMNAKHPTDNYKKKLQELKTAVVTSAPPDLSDPAVHLDFMKADLKMRWLEAIMESLLNDPGHSAQMTQLKQTLQAVRTTKAPSPPAPPSIPTLLSAEKSFQQLLSQLSAADKAALLAKFAPPSPDVIPPRHVDTLERATSPMPSFEPEQASRQPSISSPILNSLKTLLDRSSEAQVLELLQQAMAATTESQDIPDPVKHRLPTKAADTPLVQVTTNTPNEGLGHATSLSNRLRHRLSAVTAVAEPMEWQEFVKVGCLDVGCQTSFDGEPQASPNNEDDVLGASNGAISPRGALRGSVVPGKMVPLTLTSLLGKNALNSGAKKDRKESGTKYLKINSTTVPRAISGLITSWRMNADQLVQFAKKSLANVLKIIADAYSEMLTAGRRKTQQQQQQAYATQRGSGRELTLAQIVYQSFLHSYGLPGIADMHLLAFSCALETYRLQHLRVEYFARFCFEEVPKVELTNYLEFLECLVCDDVSAASLGMTHLSNLTSSPASPSVNSRGLSPPQQQQQSSTVATRLRFVPRINVPDKENWQISVERAQEAAQLCFRDMRKTTVSAFCEQLALLAVHGTSTAVLPVATGGSGSSTETTTSAANTAGAAGGELLLNVDHLLQLVVHEWRDEQTRRERHLLDTFRAGDVNGDGQLTSAEFTQIVLSIDATRELGDILLMYSDTLRRVQCEQLDAHVFLQVAREHELDRAVWLGDGDLYSVVNEVTDMEATWAHVRSFFLGTLEALARDLPTAHFLRVCEGAGCGCLKCLLDGYIGFQKMRREFALSSAPKSSPGRRNSVVGVSSQLVWARFWHLMRQLHDAATQSDGLATPWEGSDVTRETPAPPLAPRSLVRRRHALPNFLFPDTTRISAQISAVHDPEAFDADAINAQFAYLLSHVSVKTPEATPHASTGQQKARRASSPASS